MYKEFQILYYQETSIKDSIGKAKSGVRLKVEGWGRWSGGEYWRNADTSTWTTIRNNPIINIFGVLLYW